MSDDWDPKEHHRNTDPDTSAQAAETVSTVTRHKRALMQAHYDVLHRASYQGLTAHEAAELAGLDDYAGSKRCSDLLAAGYLEWWKAEDEDLADREGYLCRRNPSGKLARVMVPTREGIDWLQG
jgi:hypothetical protein